MLEHGGGFAVRDGVDGQRVVEMRVMFVAPGEVPQRSRSGSSAAEQRLRVLHAPRQRRSRLYLRREAQWHAVGMYHYVRVDAHQQIFIAVAYTLISNWLTLPNLDPVPLFIVASVIWVHVLFSALEIWCLTWCDCASAATPHHHGIARARLVLSVTCCAVFGVRLLPYSLLALYETYLQSGYALKERMYYYDR